MAQISFGKEHELESLMSSDCGMPSPECPICSVRGSFSSKAQIHAPSTLPPDASREYAAEHDAGVWRIVLALLGEIPGTSRWQVSQYAWEDWDCGPQVGALQQLTGHHGQMHCR